MTVVGINSTTNESGVKNSTLQLLEEYDSFYNNPAAGRSSIGKKASSVYVGGYDVSNIKVGMEIEIYYDKAISTRNGMFQMVKRIEVIK